MTEPTSSVAAAAASGVAALTIALLGVEPQALFYGGVGAALGLTFAPEASKLRAALTFIAVVLTCAALGTWGSAQWFSGTAPARNGLALALGMVFHPMFTNIVGKIPEIIDGVMRKAGLK